MIKSKELLLLAFLLTGFACQSPPAPIRDGSSFEHAIKLRAADHGAGVDAEVAWLRKNLPGAHLAEGGVDAAGKEYIYFPHRTESHGKAIFSIYIMQLPDGRVVEVYFDQSYYFGR